MKKSYMGWTMSSVYYPIKSCHIFVYLKLNNHKSNYENYIYIYIEKIFD